MKTQYLAVFAAGAALAMLLGCGGRPVQTAAGASSVPPSSTLSSAASAASSSLSSLSPSSSVSAPSSAPPTSPASASSSSGSAPYTPPVLESVPESAQADPSFLNGAVFVGDSVTLKLKNYVTQKRKSDPDFFGTAAFLAAGSMGSGNALMPVGPDSIHPLYNGEKASLEDNAARMGADKIYIMLGINDVAPYGVEGAADNMEKLALRFTGKIPGVKLYIQSATPMLADKQKKTLNNPNLESYNRRLSQLCQKRGWYFLDIASVMRDDTGALKSEYCSDPDDLGLHFTDEACDVWIHYILTHTGG